MYFPRASYLLNCIFQRIFKNVVVVVVLSVIQGVPKTWEFRDEFDIEFVMNCNT